MIVQRRLRTGGGGKVVAIVRERPDARAPGARRNRAASDAKRPRLSVFTRRRAARAAPGRNTMTGPAKSADFFQQKRSVLEAFLSLPRMRSLRPFRLLRLLRPLTPK